MISISKVIGVMSCGFLLCLGLAGNAASAADEMNAGQAADRIGGQGGLGDKLEKEEGVAGQAADRIGGQTGLKRDREKLEGVADK
jgi:hypothetical protein